MKLRAYLRTWNFMRVLRLAVGVFIAVQGFETGEWWWTALGGGYAVLTLTTAGSCSYCSYRVPKIKKHEIRDDVTFDEVR